MKIDENGHLIDVSHHNYDRSGGHINWGAVKGDNDNIQGVIIKLTEGTSFVDPCGERAVTEARAAGFEKVGVYHFCHFNTVAEAEKEAAFFKDHIAKVLKDIDFVAADFEYPKTSGDATDAMITFCSRLEGLGVEVGIYGSPYFIDAHLSGASKDKLKKYPLWIAHYGAVKPRATHIWGDDWTLWQYADSAVIDGIHGPVDINRVVVSFLHPEKQAEPVPDRVEPPAPSKSTDEIAVRGHIKIVGVKHAAYICNVPSEHSHNLGVAPLGSVWPISGSVPGWWEVIYNGHRAYVSAQYGDKVDSSEHRTTSSKPTKVTYNLPNVVLNFGDRGTNVKTVQNALNILGLDCGKADGIYGIRTKAAVVGFQHKNHLITDGIYGPKTRQAMLHALNQ